ncbi:MAG: response regulator, partial [Pseudomonadales bacterium]|nr:response regulator [Pseudomonadales bacterium]
MSSSTLLVVEDEVLVARDIKSRLTRMGYHVVDTASRGAEAVEKALALRPDLILMDINLRDDMDGVEAALKIRSEYDVPVIFCTAYSNEDTLERAKVSDPYGYVLKPFDNRELEINIEIALYKHRMERDLEDTRNRLDATLANISDAVIAAGIDGRIMMMNPAAEDVTGWCEQKARHLNLLDVLQLEPLDAAEPRLDVSQLGSNQLLRKGERIRQYVVQPGGGKCPVEINVNLIPRDNATWMVITFREIAQQLSYEEEIRRTAFYDDVTQLPNRALFMNRLESSLKRRLRGSREQFAVAFVDLDGFSAINEGL